MGEGMSKQTVGIKKAPRLRGRSRRGHWLSEENFHQLRERLREAQETLDAIRSGEVDAVVVNGARGNQIYSLTGADQPYRVYVEQMQEGAVTVSGDGLVLYSNQRFADMVRIPLERVISSKIHQHLPPPAWKKISGVLSANDGVVKYECQLNRAGGALKVNLTASRLPLEGQSVMCLVVTDLTEQKEQEELRLAKEVAEKANEAKDTFLAALSHELRTPLTPVLMASAALEQDDSLSPRVRQELAMIRRNVELETRLIDDLLDLTRVARGKLEFQVGPMNLNTTLQRALEVCRPHLDRKRQRVIFQLEATRVESEGDAVRLQQAFWNLISNAIKFTSEDGTITIRTRNPAPDAIAIVIQDSGVGFEPARAAKLFQAFEQGGRGVTRQFGGLGLGLAICRSIVESHGGVIQAQSEGLGKGATFTLQLPLRPSNAPPARAISRSPEETAPREGAGKQILLVEDHNDTRTSLEMLLRKHKHEVKTAASAREALALARTNKFDFVISDIGLPDQSGLELMSELRDRFGLKGIGLSGYGMEEDILRSRAAGFVHHLVKPIRFDRLKQLISEMEKIS
jgi:PAS domain S-box-containing protein